ncbi:MAG: hypothetical protein ABIS45_16290 [Burkholderiales bacterium]
MTWGRFFLIVLLVCGSFQYWHGHKVRAPAVAVTAAMDREWEAYGYKIIPLEKFNFEARVLHTEDYSMDREAQLAPVDLALGWGPMDNPAVLEKVSITQSNRFYYWHVDEFPISRRDIEVNSANMHMVPASAEVERTLKSIRPGQHVRFAGYLIEARGPDGWRWRSSLTREDTGTGACELVWVEQISAL